MSSYDEATKILDNLVNKHFSLKKENDFDLKLNKQPDTDKLLELFKLLPETNNNSYKILFNNVNGCLSLKIMKEVPGDKNRIYEVFTYPNMSSNSFNEYLSFETLISDAEKYIEELLEKSFKKYYELKNKSSDNLNLEMPDTTKLKRMATLYFKDEDLSERCEVQFRTSNVNGKNILSFTMFISNNNNPLGEVLCHFPTKTYHNGYLIPNLNDGKNDPKNFSELVKEAELSLQNLLKEKINNLDETKRKINVFLNNNENKKFNDAKKIHNKYIEDNCKPAFKKEEMLIKILESLSNTYVKLVLGNNYYSCYEYRNELNKNDELEDFIVIMGQKHENNENEKEDAQQGAKYERKDVFVSKGYKSSIINKETLLRKVIDELKAKIKSKEENNSKEKSSIELQEIKQIEQELLKDSKLPIKVLSEEDCIPEMRKVVNDLSSQNIDNNGVFRRIDKKETENLNKDNVNKDNVNKQVLNLLEVVDKFNKLKSQINLNDGYRLNINLDGYNLLNKNKTF